jgi:glycosyltransferase involved in cell wall biosynthesis
LVRFIREVDRVIELFTTLQLPLLVAWSWPDEDYLKSIAWPTITFVWHIWNREEKIAIMKHARWLINLAKESCGIATMEALSLGVPVFGYGQWGSREIVARDETQDVLQNSCIVSPYGVLVQDKSPQSLLQGMQLFVQQSRDRKKIQHDMYAWIKTHTQHIGN